MLSIDKKAMFFYTELMFVGYFLLFTLFFMVAVSIMKHDKIDIQFSDSYLEEYNECQNILERTQPICPEVTCKSDGGLPQGIFGFMLGLIFMGLISRYNDFLFKKNSHSSKINDDTERGVANNDTSPQ